MGAQDKNLQKVSHHAETMESTKLYHNQKSASVWGTDGEGKEPGLQGGSQACARQRKEWWCEVTVKRVLVKLSQGAAQDHHGKENGVIQETGTLLGARGSSDLMLSPPGQQKTSWEPISGSSLGELVKGCMSKPHN